MIRWKALPWLLGVALLAVSLVAALRNADTPLPGGSGGPVALVSPLPAGAVTCLGTVDTDPPVMPIHAPGVLGLSALTVDKVLVREGDSVKPGDVLVQFDPTQFVHEVAVAEQKLNDAQWRLELAQLQREDFPRKLALQQLAVEVAEMKVKTAITKRDVGRRLFDRTLDAEFKPSTTAREPLSDAEKKRRREESQELIDADAAVELFKKGLEKEQADLKRLEATRSDANGQRLTPADLDHQRVIAEVEGIREAIKSAKAKIEAFKLKAQVGGTVERLTAAPGMPFGPTAREPLLYLVPAGKRVVRAEAEAEFAHKIDAYVGKTVTVYDGSNFAVTYPGVVRRVVPAFLPKRYGDSPLGPQTRVRECVIELTDPDSPGKPSLYPGQPVRVVFGQ
jgi:multidrug resistance efflux pump